MKHISRNLSNLIGLILVVGYIVVMNDCSHYRQWESEKGKINQWDTINYE